VIDVVCEVFGCTPSVAERELDRDYELVMGVIHARAYARAKALYDSKSSMSEERRRALMADPMVKRVSQTEMALAQQALDEATHGDRP
jgi:hypothetical protein